jgi:ABC-type antimicrobial peptide transport system permease subunit
MALGAQQGNVIWIVMKEVLLLIGIGVLAGIPLALGLGTFVRNQLFGLAPDDPITIAGSALALAGVAALAGFIPAFRASRIDPTHALRYE